MSFEWDQNKAAGNLRKHGIDFADAVTVFDDFEAITIDDPEGIRKRLLAQDNIGIVPGFYSLHRANQHFSEEDDVFDVLYFDDLGRYKARIKPFITWEPLPVLKPKKNS